MSRRLLGSIFDDVVAMKPRRRPHDAAHEARRCWLQVQQGRELYKAEDVAVAAAQEAVPHEVTGVDYFFSTRDGFPWAAIPPFVVGRPTFDNWLVGNVPSSLSLAKVLLNLSETAH